MNGSCSKNFPLNFQQETTIGSNRIVMYKRRDDKRFVQKDAIYLIIGMLYPPYNRELLIRFQTYINIQWFNNDNAIKYLSKYINNEPDKGTKIVEDNNSLIEGTKDEKVKEVYEIMAYLNC